MHKTYLIEEDVLFRITVSDIKRELVILKIRTQPKGQQISQIKQCISNVYPLLGQQALVRLQGKVT